MDNPNDFKNQKLRSLKRKYEAIIEKGGKCEICGYDKNLAALEFHHINPDTKKFQIDSRHFSNRSLDVLKEELDKCMLLCSNCHRELHNPEYILSDIPKQIETITKLSFSNKHEAGQTCPVCGKKFPKLKGKKYCSNDCRWKDKNYPTIDEINVKYTELKSWDKVAKHFNLTRKIIQGIRKRCPHSSIE